MSQEMKEGMVRRLPMYATDLPDAVDMAAQCNITQFKTGGKKQGVIGIGNQFLANCKIMASFENGVVSISVHSQRPFMVSVRLDEMMALLKEAADYHMEVTPGKGENKKEEPENE